MDSSFDQNSVIPSPWCNLPPEIQLQILHQTRIMDIKNCRLVSSCWNQYGIEVLRKIHPVICFTSDRRLKQFMEAMPIGPLPFSDFDFDMYTQPQYILKFLDKYGSSICKLRIDMIDFLEHFSQPLTPASEICVNALSKISDLAFSPTLKLESLGLVLFTATLPTYDQLLVARHPHLKKLELLVTTHVGATEVDRFIEELVRISPALQEFVIGNGTSNSDANSKFLENLPNWLKRIPRNMRVGLRLGEVNDSVLALLQWPVLQHINLFFLTMQYVNFVDTAVSNLFCKWLFQQPLEQLQVGYGINWENNDEERTFNACKELTLSTSLSSHLEDPTIIANYRRMLRCFPNVTRVTLLATHQEWLILLGNMLPRLEYLCFRTINAWSIFAGITGRKVSDIFAGLEAAPTPDESPFRELRALKHLGAWIVSVDELLPIVYCSKQGILPRLEKLRIGLDWKGEARDTREIITKYGQSLSEYHDTVLFKSIEIPELNFCIYGKK